MSDTISNDTIRLALTLDEVNLILEGLGELPFRRVFHLIGHIQAAARAQIDSEGHPTPAGNGHPSRESGGEALASSNTNGAGCTEEVPQ